MKELFDKQEIRRGCEVLDGDVPDVREVRTFGYLGKTHSGYYNDREKLVSDVAEVSGKAEGVYITLNPVKKELLARAANRLKALVRQNDRATHDDEIMCRRWFLVDIDPRRPARISATDGQHDAALLKAYDVSDTLRLRGRPEPLFVDSGNGAHLLYRVDLPNNKESTELMEACLRGLAFQFDDDKVKPDSVEIDATTFNASRLVKLPGTLAAKGDDIPERPHRLAVIHDEPREFQVVSLELLRELSACLPQPESEPNPGWSRNKTAGFLDVARWIAEHKLEVEGPADWERGLKWIFNACPFDAEHHRTAFIVQFPNGAIAARCLYASCEFKKWHDLRDLVEPGWRNPGSSKVEGHAEKEGKPAPPKESRATKLIKLAEAVCSEFFHTSDQRAYARLMRDSHREVWPVGSSGFRHYLAKLFYDHEGTALSSESLRQALSVLQGTALYAGEEHPVYTRAAYIKPDIYLDLGDPAWRAVRIYPGGWEIIPHSDPLRFRRPPSMLPCRTPSRASKSRGCGDSPTLPTGSGCCSGIGCLRSPGARALSHPDFER
jgi:hypothetical protein